MVEAIAEIDDNLIEKYLGGEEISLEELKTNLRQAVLSGSIIPILSGSALQNIGMSWLMDAVCDYLEQHARAGDVIVTMGAGDVWKVADEYIQRLRRDS